MEIYNVDDPKFGILLYRDAISDELNLIERLEKTLNASTHEYFKWNEASVGYNEKMPDYRDCLDLKISPLHFDAIPEELSEIKNIHKDTEDILKKCLDDYQARYNFKMEFMEAINFVKYNPGQHFSVHTDQGFSYNCTLSSILYLNDDYEGGELWFPYLEINFKPKKGDVIFFPSTFIYAHGAKPVISGTKYSAVTMFDYKDNNLQFNQIVSKEQQEQEEENGTKLRKVRNINS